MCRLSCAVREGRECGSKGRCRRPKQLEELRASQSVSGHWGMEFGRWLGSNYGRVPDIQNLGEEDREGVEGKV